MKKRRGNEVEKNAMKKSIAWKKELKYAMKERRSERYIEEKK